MLIYADEVRRSMRRRPPEELRRIASGRAAEYTPEAQEIAGEVLAEKLAMPPAEEPPPAPGAPRRPTLRQRFAGWRRRQLPASIPDRIADLFWMGILFAGAAVFPLLRIAFQLPPANEDVITLLLAAGGVTLAYGISASGSTPARWRSSSSRSWPSSACRSAATQKASACSTSPRSCTPGARSSTSYATRKPSTITRG